MLTATKARADDRIAVHVDYSAPAGCPDANAFRRDVSVRAPTLAFDDRDPMRTFRVTLRSAPSAFEGEIAVFSRGEARGARRLSGATCAEVASALALVLTLDVTSAIRDREDEAPRAANPSRDVGRWRLGVGAGASLVGGVAPDLLYGLGGHVELLRFSRSVLAPSLRLGVARSFTRDFDLGSASVAFTATTAELDGCPLRLAWRQLTLVPCIRIEGGALEADATGTSNARDDVRGWMALGVVGRASWWLVGPLAIEIEGGARAAFVRGNYVILPDLSVYDAPILSATGRVGVSVYFF
jgi:hypothetical protein